MGVYSVSHSAFSSTELIRVHIPTQGGGGIGAWGPRWERTLARKKASPVQSALKFSAGGASLGTNHAPLGVPAPYAPKCQPAASQASDQSEEALGGRCRPASH